MHLGALSDKIRSMTTIRITAVDNPFDSQRVARLAVGLISTAEAMGLLGGMEIHRLDMATFRRVVDRIASAGIGTEVQAVLNAPADAGVPAEIGRLLGRLALAVEESPAPAHEWRSLERLFGVESLASLLGVSPASVRRYLAGSRETPDGIAVRLHFLATVVGDLAGAYNEIGIRRWFERSRALLDDRKPADLLRGEWDPESPQVQRVREIARSLGASAALLPGHAAGWTVKGGLQPGPPRNGEIYVLFGHRPDFLAWPVTLEGQPPAEALDRVSHF